MSSPPTTPYPPDPDEDAPAPVDLGDLVDVVAADLDWAGQRAPGLSARRVELRRCRLTGAELAEATLSDVVFDECRIDLAGLRHAKLERVVFRDCKMDGCDLYGAKLKDVVLERCTFVRRRSPPATLQHVELRGCDLAGIVGAEALRGAGCRGTT